MTSSATPEIVDQQQWQAAIDMLRQKEKELTRTHDALNAMRRQLPMVRVDKDYRFQGAEGTVTLSDLFDGRKQLVVYHFMFGPDQEAGCDGCSWVVDAMSHPAHLHARDTSIALISRAPLEKLSRYQERMGWDIPWYSSFGSDFNYDFDATNDDGENHVLSIFLKDGDHIYRTYYTDQRGVEHLGSHWTYLDLTPFGRQEDSGWPKRDKYWPRRHDEYTE